MAPQGAAPSQDILDWDGSGAAPRDAGKIPHLCPAGSRAVGFVW